MKKSSRFQVVGIHIDDAPQGGRGPLVQYAIVFHPGVTGKCLRIDKFLVQFRADRALDLAGFFVLGIDFQDGFRRFQALLMTFLFKSFSCEVG